MKHIMITGASGFVGSYLARMLLERGERVTGLGTSSCHPFAKAHDHFTWLSADTSREGAWQDLAAESDAIINLAGRNIFKRWSRTCKKAIYDSRILTTRNLVAGLGENWNGHLLSVSGMGYYGDRGDAVLDETEPGGSDFLAQVCADWEAAALEAKSKGAAVSLMRFGVILGQGGGALDVMGKVFKCFLGGPLGAGRQYFPWMHLADLGAAVAFLMQGKIGGTFNFCGPKPVRQREFARAMGRALKRPALTPAPACMVRLVMGELGTSLLMGQNATPKALQKEGFTFKYNTVEEALKEVYGSEFYA
ncbi:MAG: TIGR01777 family protein [Acidobacteria bacterium]|nr:MAG: TIGR01777 family protein [Acidobacteriota bacterium]PIE89165.1 MAG: TIGR01777 family protein [Acidobacteriota bacterium]